MIDANPGPYARRAAQKKPYGFKTSELCSRVQWSAIQSNQRNTLGPVEIFYSGTRTLPRAKNPEELRILKLLKTSQKRSDGLSELHGFAARPAHRSRSRRRSRSEYRGAECKRIKSPVNL